MRILSNERLFIVIDVYPMWFCERIMSGMKLTAR